MTKKEKDILQQLNNALNQAHYFSGILSTKEDDKWEKIEDFLNHIMRYANRKE